MFWPYFSSSLRLFLLLIPLMNLSYTFCAIYNRYSPQFEKPESVTLNRSLKVKIELLANYGASEKMKRTARQAILDVFSGIWPPTGDESNHIGEVMERHFGGFWMVAIFVSPKRVESIRQPSPSSSSFSSSEPNKDIDFDAAYTIVRRSPSYMLFGVNNRAILVAREGNGSRRRNNANGGILL